MLGERSLDGRNGIFELAARSEREPAAARADGKAPGDLRSRGASLEPVDEPLAALEVAGGERSLGSIAVDAPDRRLGEVHLVEERHRDREVPVRACDVARGELREA